MKDFKIIIPHEGVNEIPQGYRPLMTVEGKLVAIVPEEATIFDFNWLKTERITPVINWEQRRYEIAKDLSCAYLQAHSNIPFFQIAEVCVEFADEVIKQLKTEKI